MALRQFLKIFAKNTIPVGKCTLALIITKCSSFEKSDVKLQLSNLKTDNLSFDYMLQQSTINSVNNTSQVLTITYTAIETISKEYRYLLTKLIHLIRESIMFKTGDEHWDQILKMRSQVEDKKRIVTQLVQHMDYVHKMAAAVSEVCYSTGMDNLSQTLCQRIDDAMNKIQIEVNQNNLLELEYANIQEQSIKKSNTNADEIQNKFEE